MADTPDPFLRTAREALRHPPPQGVASVAVWEKQWTEWLAALLRQQDATSREALASAMNDCSLATGHGDTHADLLMELVWQVKELREKAVTSRREERTRVLEEVFIAIDKGIAADFTIETGNVLTLLREEVATLQASSGEERGETDD